MLQPVSDRPTNHTLITARRDALTRSLLSAGLSICLSVTFLYCIKESEDVVKLQLLSQSVSTIIPVLWHQAPVPNSKGNAFSGAQNTRRWKNCGLRLKSSFISETVRDRPIVWNVNRKSQMASVSMTLSDLERRYARDQIFQADLLNKLVPFDHDQIWHDNVCGEECISGNVLLRGQPCPYRKGAGPHRSSFLGFPSIYARTLWRKATKFDVVIYVRDRNPVN